MVIGCTVGELGRRMGAGEFGHWLAFLAAEEVGPRADVHRAAALLAALHNGPLTRRDKALWKPAEFVPRGWQPEPRPGSKPAKPAGAADARAHIARQRQAQQQARAATAAARRKP